MSSSVPAAPASALPFLSLLAAMVVLTGCPAAREEPAPGASDASRTALDEEAPEEQALMMETVLYLLEDGVAVGAPAEDAEPSLRVAKDERYRIAEQRPGWYRLVTEWPEIQAWVPESSVRTAEELAPPTVINERLTE